MKTGVEEMRRRVKYLREKTSDVDENLLKNIL